MTTPRRAQVGLRNNDVIIAANRGKVSTVQQLEDRAKTALCQHRRPSVLAASHLASRPSGCLEPAGEVLSVATFETVYGSSRIDQSESGCN